MDFTLLQASTGRVRIAADKEVPDLTKEGQRTIQSSKGLSRLIGPWKVGFLECLQGVIVRNGMHHLEAARWHTDLVLKREKQADSVGRRAAAVLASAGQVPKASELRVSYLSDVPRIHGEAAKQVG
jgi:hypothetical protein